MQTTPESALAISSAAVPAPALGVRRLGGLLAGVAAIVIWAMVPTLVKLALSTGQPISAFLLVRYGTVSLLLAFLLPRIVRKARQVPLRLTVGCGTIVVIHIVFQTLALQSRVVTSSWYTLVFSTSPMLTLLLLRVAWTLRLQACLTAAIVGSFCFIDGPDLVDPRALPAVGALVISVTSWAAVTVLLVRLQKCLTDLELTTVLNWCVAAPARGMWCADGRPGYRIDAVNGLALAVLILAVPFAFLLFLYSVRVVPLFAICSQYLEVGFGVAVGVIVLGDPFAVRQVLGLLLVSAALIAMPPNPTRESKP